LLLKLEIIIIANRDGKKEKGESGKAKNGEIAGKIASFLPFAFLSSTY
jgi:hypothetical protein